MYLFGILCLVAATAALPVLPDPSTFTNSVAAAHQGSEMQIYNQHRAIASASLQDIKDNDEVKKRVFKIGSVIFPPPPQLQLFDYSILRKQKAAQNQKYEDTVKQNCENAKKEIVFVISGNPVKVQLPANPAALIDSVTTAQDSDLCSNIFIVATDSALIANRKEDEDLKPNMIKIASTAIPAPPELPLFDYSILEKQLANQKQKFEEALKQEPKKYKVKEMVIIDQENPVKVRVRPNPATLTGFVPVLENSEGRVNTIHVDTDSTPVTDEKDDEKVEHSMAKIATIVLPSPPELPPFDYSILKQQKADYNLKSQYAAMKATEKSKGEKEALIVNLEKPVKVEVPANPTTLIDSVTAARDSEVSALVADKKDDEEVNPNIVKIASIVIPAPPELSVFDYSILEKQLADQKQKSEEILKQEAEKSKGEKEALIVNLEEPVKVKVPANPTILIDSVTAVRDSEVSALVADKKDDEEVHPNIVKIASIVIPAPPELSVFDYSILEKQLADQKQKSEEILKQEAEKSKGEKEALIVNLEEPVKVEVPANPTTLIDSVTAVRDSEVSALVADKKDDEEVNPNIVKIASIVIPAPPELSVFDYSILEKQLADQKQKSEEILKQEAEKSKGEKEALIVNLEEPVKVEVPANPTTLIDSVTAARDSEVSALVADKKDDEDVKPNIVKIASIVIPAPPELSVFDYSILEKQLADQKQKSEKAQKKEAEKYKNVKEALILDQEKPAKVEMPTNKATLFDSVTAPQNSQVRANILNVVTDSASVTDNKDDEKVKLNRVKIATVIIPPPPELPPFDYSILRQQKADYYLRSEYFAKEAAEKSKGEKEAVIIDLEKPVKINIRPNPATLTGFETAFQDSEVHANILNIATDSAQAAEKKDDEESKHNVVKSATVIIPSPPELPPFDNSILKNHIDEHQQKCDYFLKLEAEKPEKKKDVLIIEEPVEVKEHKLIEESQFVGDSKPIEESKPVEESKLIEVLKKEPVKHLEDIPVIIQWTITSAPLLSKLISNYPPLPSFGLNWALQKPSKTGHSGIIDPKLNLDGYTYTN